MAKLKNLLKFTIVGAERQYNGQGLAMYVAESTQSPAPEDGPLNPPGEIPDRKTRI